MKVFISILFFFFSNLSYSQSTYCPPTNNNNWDSISPNTLNWCQDSINSLYNFLETENSKSFILLKDGKIVLEKYFGTYTQDSSFLWYSAAKSLRAILIGKAQEEGYLNITDKTSDYLGQNWTSLPLNQEDSITIWNQLTMTTGLNENNFTCENPSCLNYMANAGTRWAYHNGPYGLLKSVLENATGVTLNSYTNSKIKNPIGMNGFWISVLGINTFYSKAKSMARYGLLVSNKGIWNNDTVISDSNFIHQMITPSQTLNPSYGYLWWLNGQANYITTGTPVNVNNSISPDAPTDTYTAAGSQGQFISISPSNGLIMIRQGLSSNGGLTDFALHNEIWKRIMRLSCNNSSGIENTKTINSIKILPNPSSDLIKVSIKNSSQEISEVKIYNLAGQLLVKTHNSIISIKDLPKGNYILRVHSSQQVISQIFIKN
jgi:CubicO group peptidase (beta-lactamase class C family)